MQQIFTVTHKYTLHNMDTFVQNYTLRINVGACAHCVCSCCVSVFVCVKVSGCACEWACACGHTQKDRKRHLRHGFSSNWPASVSFISFATIKSGRTVLCLIEKEWLCQHLLSLIFFWEEGKTFVKKFSRLKLSKSLNLPSKLNIMFKKKLCLLIRKNTNLTACSERQLPDYFTHSIS